MSAELQPSRSFILGFHGCDEAVGRRLISGGLSHLSPSKNPYDWIGDGIYFFENDPERARHFANTATANPDLELTRGQIKNPFVVGAVIDLGHCLDLSNQRGIAEAAYALDGLRQSRQDRPLPKNKKAAADDRDLILRNLDRAIINYLHALRRSANLIPYDTVRSPFSQGQPLAETSAFQRYSHVQIAVRNANCILGYFLPQNALKAPFQGLE